LKLVLNWFEELADSVYGIGSLYDILRYNKITKRQIKEVHSKARFIGPSIVEAADWILTKEAK
jgi:hypothetical protein